MQNVLRRKLTTAASGLIVAALVPLPLPYVPQRTRQPDCGRCRLDVASRSWGKTEQTQRRFKGPKGGPMAEAGSGTISPNLLYPRSISISCSVVLDAIKGRRTCNVVLADYTHFPHRHCGSMCNGARRTVVWESHDGTDEHGEHPSLVLSDWLRISGS